jgi:hypothetical protein
LSTIKEWADAQKHELQAVALQRNYLRNPLPPGDGVCGVCRSSAGEGFDVCYQCNQHRNAAGGQVADIVAPISYAIKGTQHAHNLAIYKAVQPSASARFNLSALGVMHLAYHWECFTSALGAPFTHIATVPSTRGRQGTHPIQQIADRFGLPSINATPNAIYPNEDRNFHADRFYLAPGAAGHARILLLDDTWTTGSRIQSLAFALKQAGAASVAAVVLGRHVNPSYALSRPLVDRLRTAGEFDLTRCALDDLK